MSDIAPSADESLRRLYRAAHTGRPQHAEEHERFHAVLSAELARLRGIEQRARERAATTYADVLGEQTRAEARYILGDDDGQ